MLVGEHGAEVGTTSCQHNSVSIKFLFFNAEGDVTEVFLVTEFSHGGEERGGMCGCIKYLTAFRAATTLCRKTMTKMNYDKKRSPFKDQYS